MVFLHVPLYWNRLSREVLDALSLETVKVGLDGALPSLICCRSSVQGSRAVGLDDLYRSPATQMIL